MTNLLDLVVIILNFISKKIIPFPPFFLGSFHSHPMKIRLKFESFLIQNDHILFILTIRYCNLCYCRLIHFRISTGCKEKNYDNIAGMN